MNTKVAIIGLGNIGKAIAENLSNGHHHVLVASRDLNSSSKYAENLGANIEAKDIPTALKEADIIIPSIYFNALQDFIKDHFEALKGKTIIDVSNPIAPDGNGGFKKIIGDTESAGEILAKLIPNQTTFIKAFGTLGAASLVKEANQRPEKKVLFYVSETKNIDIEKLIEDSGFDAFYSGGLENAIKLEVFGELHEFGALGGTTTLKELQK